MSVSVLVSFLISSESPLSSDVVKALLKSGMVHDVSSAQ